MATRMITRTIEETTCEVLCIKFPSNETEIRTFITGKVKSPAEALSIIQRKFDNENGKALHVLKMEVKTKLYGMEEDVFMRYAKLLPDRKIYDNE